MYFSVFSSSEYYSDEEINKDISIDEDDLCLICWLPGDETNELKLLSDFSHIKTLCKCKPKIHSICINDWIKKTPSCPICRTKLNIIIFNGNAENVFINCYIGCISYTVYFLKIVSYASFLNLLCLLFYNIYSIYFMINNHYEDNYGIY